MRCKMLIKSVIFQKVRTTYVYVTQHEKTNVLQNLMNIHRILTQFLLFMQFLIGNPMYLAYRFCKFYQMKKIHTYYNMNRCILCT